jgi:hypothetical protein
MDPLDQSCLWMGSPLKSSPANKRNFFVMPKNTTYTLRIKTLFVNFFRAIRVKDIVYGGLDEYVNSQRLILTNYSRVNEVFHDSVTNKYRVKGDHMEPANIFDYADKELASTAFLCWLFSHSYKDCTSNDKKTAADDLLHTFCSMSQINVENKTVYVNKIIKDYKLTHGKRNLKIDICLHVKVENEDLYLFVENKVNSMFSGANQLVDYSAAIDKRFGNNSYKPIKIYYKSKYDLDAPLVLGRDKIETGFLKFDHRDVNEIFSKYTDTSSEILNSYSKSIVGYESIFSGSIDEYKNNHSGYYKLFYALFGSCLDNKESQDPKHNRVHLSGRIGFLENGTSFGRPYLVFAPCADMRHIFVRLENNLTLRCGCWLGKNIKGNPFVDDIFVEFKKAVGNHNFKHADKVKLKKNRDTAFFLKIDVVDIEDFKCLKDIIIEYTTKLGIKSCFQI